MKILILLCCVVLSGSAYSAKIYKCTKVGGGTTYQNKPCAGFGGGERQQLIVPDKAPKSRGQAWYRRQASTPTFTGGSARRVNNNKYDDAINRIDNRHCQLYMDWLSEAKEEWEMVRKQGYKQNQKRRHQQRIKNAERDVRRECN
ncbi:MAG: DUF4124 domain-containing protein [Desulfobacteraceae bacterium]|nr:DUF4124 domain-containing protein [Desulfobacteraceae bacterium]